MLCLNKPRELVAGRFRGNLFFSVRFKDVIEPSYDVESGGACSEQEASTDLTQQDAESSTVQTILGDLARTITGCLGPAVPASAQQGEWVGSGKLPVDVAIVYTFKKATADALASSLQSQGIAACSYHRSAIGVLIHLLPCALCH